MTKSIKSISNPRLKLDILSLDDVDKIHDATLEIIEKTGVRFPSQKALEIWKTHGATVDDDTMVVKASPDLIEEAISKCPPVYPLAAREESQDLLLDGNHVYVGTDGCGVQIVDIETGELRASQLKDVTDIATVADQLEQVAFHWVPISAQDKPAETRGLHEIKTIWEHSTKHVQTESIYSEVEAHAAVEMAKLIAGGAETARKRPPLSVMQCTLSPLGHDKGSLEAGLIAAEAGLPVGFMTMVACLTTGPATLAGSLAVGNAEVISGAALIQLAHPGTPFFYAAAQTASDLRTGAYTGGGPEDFLFGASTNVLADYYNMPLSMGSFATGAKEPDWQAGIENSLSTFMASLVMSDMLLGVGLLYGSRIFSFEQLLMDCEIFDVIRQVMEGILVDDETLALDVIHAVGPSGNYLAQKHTKAHMREIWLPDFIDRRPYADWEKDKKASRNRARAKAKELLKNDTPDPLDPKISAEFEKIITSIENK
jgi:trimethylamine--corrinoid protein Co-methyltransferase